MVKLLLTLFFTFFAPLSLSWGELNGLETRLQETATYFTRNFKDTSYSDVDVYNLVRAVKKNRKLYPFYLLKFEGGRWNLFSIKNGPKSINTGLNIDYLITWLNKNATDSIKNGLTLVVYPQEPYLSFQHIDNKTQSDLLKCSKKVPLLLPCLHPKFAWTYEAILMPDPWMLQEGYKKQLTLN
ncbi:MAG TPA: hypothetical protein VI959_05155 [Alphaproteobacteria bacterium]|nr:hypothetical protein [Alphaproteobacteria bacterium]